MLVTKRISKGTLNNTQIVTKFLITQALEKNTQNINKLVIGASIHKTMKFSDFKDFTMKRAKNTILFQLVSEE